MPLVEIHKHYHYHGDSSSKKQTKASRVMLIIQALLGSAWITMIGLTLLKVPFAVQLGNQVVWVAIISYYANAFTNFGGAIGAFSALVSGEDHKEEDTVEPPDTSE